jgi:hypothetical protein
MHSTSESREINMESILSPPHMAGKLLGTREESGELTSVVSRPITGGPGKIQKLLRPPFCALAQQPMVISKGPWCRCVESWEVPIPRTGSAW